MYNVQREKYFVVISKSTCNGIFNSKSHHNYFGKRCSIGLICISTSHLSCTTTITCIGHTNTCGGQYSCYNPYTAAASIIMSQLSPPNNARRRKILCGCSVCSVGTYERASKRAIVGGDRRRVVSRARVLPHNTGPECNFVVAAVVALWSFLLDSFR